MTDKERTDRVEDPAEDRALSTFLEALGPTLRDPAVWAEPPPALAESIAAAIAAEKGAAASRRPRSRCRPRHRFGWFRPPWTPSLKISAVGAPCRGVVAVAAAAAIVGLVLGLVTRDDGAGDEELHLAGTELAPEADATVEVKQLSAGRPCPRHPRSGACPRRFLLPGPGALPETEPVSVGTFHMRGGLDRDPVVQPGHRREPDPDDHPLEEGGGAETSGIEVLRDLMP